jgi:hypothetical protein
MRGYEQRLYNSLKLPIVSNQITSYIQQTCINIYIFPHEMPSKSNTQRSEPPTISQTAAGTSSTARRTDTNADAAEVIQRGLTSTTMKNISNESEKGTGMIRYNITSFPTLHNEIYQIVDDIVEDSHNLKEITETEEIFIQKWKLLTSNLNPNRITQKMTWHQVQQSLNIKELSQYREFILQCPKIQQKAQLTSQRNALEFRVIPENSETERIEHSLDLSGGTKDNQENSHTGTEFKICDGTPESLQELLRLIIPIWELYINNNSDTPYARMCHEWFQGGLTNTSQLEDICKICGLHSLQDLYFLLKLSLPLYDCLYTQWDGTKILYEWTPNKIPSEQVSLNHNNNDKNDTQTRIVSDPESWQKLHTMIYPYILTWSQQDSGHLSIFWRNAINLGVTSRSTWNQLRDITKFQTYHDYYQSIATCPCITGKIKLYWDTNNAVIHCKNSIQNTSTSSKNICDLTSPSDTSAQHAILTEPTVRAITREYKTADPHANDDFGQTHYRIFHVIETWTQQPDSRTHPFRAIWYQAKYHGLNPYSDWPTVQRLINCQDYDDYIKYVTQCPIVGSVYHIVWDRDTHKIQCHLRVHPNQAMLHTAHTNNMALYNKLQDTTYEFDKTAYNIQRKIYSVQEQLAILENKVNQHTTTAHERFNKQAHIAHENITKILQHQQNFKIRYLSKQKHS